MRVFLSATLFAAGAALCAAGCGEDDDAGGADDGLPGLLDAGDMKPTPGDGGLADGAPLPPVDGAPIPPSDAATLPPDAEACAPPAATVPSGVHNPGAACATCHDGSLAPLWTVSGTLYTDLAGSAPVPGATIHVTDATGQALDLVTADNGNFWTTQAVTPPLTVAASRCPQTARMISPATTGNCNAAGCHDAGRRITLP